jgi:uncharacterized protein YndB with AHSA1/START domain
MTPDAEPDELVLHLERILPAAPAAAFRANTQVSELAKWFGPHDFLIPKIDLDVRPGGAYRIAMQPPSGEVFYLTGEVREVVEAERLVYTFEWEDPAPGDTPNTVTITFQGTDDSTTMTVEQRPFATPERLALHVAGWTDGLDKLCALLASARK